MKIGFEAKRAFKNFTGLGNYSRAVISIMAKYYPQNQYLLYTPQDNNKIRKILVEPFPNISVKTAPVKILKSYWRSFQLTKSLITDGIELFHGLSNELPANIKKSNIASIVTIHDLIFLRFPHYFKWVDRQIYHYKFKAACKNADRIIAISEQTKRDIIQYFNTNPNKIDIVYQGCDATFSSIHEESAIQDIKQKYKLPQQYLLSVGTIETRKNQLLICKALKHSSQDHKLVIVGKPTAYKQEITDFIQANHLKQQVIFLENVPFQDLPLIYQGAKIFIYPSRFEGFGIPIVEALNSKVPVIAATGSCLEEAGGPNSIYIHPDDAIALAKAIERVLEDKDLQASMITKGLAYAENFNDERIAKNLNSVYQKTIEHAKRRN
ncbi:N-acetylgalactosamine-N,N'-diacetylbacillosaminyl-diphospho-undecaprenol 4-alpha-N-acetylgalactosaminyltransferase [Pedobacter glucosidilyticus]|nr:glycosyltransferase family 1 protein [Pedobacter glucosidilyticus]KHJ38478.1 N-acetylgalactosamine-N,N'-diacetylbacillosaminyl-diphospho-undecaprenol 4-alpha-N-acetylgalactosaminyltransferase [Pedobacter glucosidilyticus]